MKPINQAIHCSNKGDCMRATLASLLEVELEMVPHFGLFGNIWTNVFTYFLWALGWEYNGNMSYSTKPDETNELLLEDSFDGFFYAVVPSKNFEGHSHAVVMNLNGVIVHDPSPTKKYQGENVLQTGNIEYWYLVKRRTDEEWEKYKNYDITRY